MSESISGSAADARTSSPSSLATLRKQIAWLETVVERGSPRHSAAVLLLTSRVVGQNVDRLARCTGLPREVVARCARRLVDNGVWRGGKLETSWEDPTVRSSDFWRDVQVAEGTLYRRLDASANPEWAPPGEWWKSYDYVARRSQAGIGASYATRQRWAPEPELPPADAESAAPEAIGNAAFRPSGPERLGRAKTEGFLPHVTIRGRAPAAEAAGTPGSEVGSDENTADVLVERSDGEAAEYLASVGGGPQLPELFEDAVWLT